MATTMERLKSGTETTGLSAGYVRLSVVDGNTGRQVEAHKLAIDRLAGELGVRVARWYVDVGSDGRSLERPALRQLMAEARSGDGGFDRVLVYGLDRLSRNAADLANVRDRLADAGVELVSVK